MADKIENNNTEEVKTRTKRKPESKEFNLDTRVNVKNLAGWTVGFGLLHDIAGGSISFMKDSSQRMTRNEILAQVNNGNKLFSGTDGNGSHATLFIDDDETREYIGYDSENKKQLIFSDEIVKKLFTMTQNEFENQIKYYIVTRAEKYSFMEAVKRLGLNDYSKIMFAEEYTGYKLAIF